MVQIEYVDIKYFRSIYGLRVDDFSDLTLFAGKNDIGKSNILKALNLFFNFQTDWQQPFEFERDFNRQRLDEVRKTTKKKQFIQVGVGFRRGPRSEGSLPERFEVTRTWYRDSIFPVERHSVEQAFARGEVSTKRKDRAMAGLQRYLQTIRFEYVPAVKDRNLFSYMLGTLQDVLFEHTEKDSSIASAVSALSDTVGREAGTLSSEFERVAGIPLRLHLPRELGDLFRAFAVATGAGEEEYPLGVRGDGIQSRFLPSLMHYVSSHSSLYYVWGFEEPENCLEHALASRLAQDMATEYSRDAQIIATTHSPAFTGLRDPRVALKRVFRDARGTTNAHGVDPQASRNAGRDVLDNELGLLEIQTEYQQKYQAALESADRARQASEHVQREVEKLKKPILLVEGQWDVEILKTAWGKLFDAKEKPFAIVNCDTNEDPVESAAGVAVLKAALESHRVSEQVLVGLFDCDAEGREKGFKELNANFDKEKDGSGVRHHKRGAAVGLLLPIPPGREEYANAGNLVMEFLFDDTHLETKVDGKGLVLEFPKIVRNVPELRLKLEPEVCTDLHLRRVTSGSKKDFATRVVPSLPVAAFASFEPLFRSVQEAISEAQARRVKRTGKGARP